MSIQTDKALTDWVDANRMQLVSQIEVAWTALPKGRMQLLTRFVESPLFVVTAWQEMTSAMRALNAPANAVAEADAIGFELEQSLKTVAYSRADQELLMKLIGRVRGQAADRQLEIVKEAVSRDAMPTRHAQLLAPLLQGPPSTGGGTAFRWFHRCGFCGLLGLEGGPHAAVALCILCAVLGRD